MLTNSYVTAPFTKGVCFPVLNCYACPLAAVACPIGSLQHFSAIHVFPFYTVGILGLVGSVVGRMTCGWICPFGFTMQVQVNALGIPMVNVRTKKPLFVLEVHMRLQKQQPSGR